MNLLGIDLKPLINKVEQHTQQQAQIIALLEEIRDTNSQIKQILKQKK